MEEGKKKTEQELSSADIERLELLHACMKRRARS